MPTAWNTEQVLALAPDAASAKSGRELASPRKWVSLGYNEAALWGECQGSGSSPYQAKVVPDEPAFHCSCPSRKFPCKHALGLFLIWAGQPGALSEGTPPAWAASWLEGRAQRAEQKSKKDQERQEKREKGEPAADPAAQKKREAARWRKVTAGTADLGLWVSDVVRQGLASLQGKPAGVWDDQARRLVDAQAPGLARRVRQIEGLPLSGEGWHEPLLERLARLHLVVEGVGRFDALSAELRAELWAVVGLPVDQETVRSRPGVRDVWQVVGQRVETEDRLRTQRTWLLGRETRRAALVLDFAYGTNQPLDAALPVGTEVDAELAFFPGSAPLRAVVKARHGPLESLMSPVGFRSVTDARSAYAETLARGPWVEAVPLVLENVLLVPKGDRWRVRDTAGRYLSVAPGFTLGWRCLGCGGGKPLVIAGEYDGAEFEPLACWVDGRLFRLTVGDREVVSAACPPSDASADVAQLWREAAASALVGTERRPPPSMERITAVCEPAAALDTRDAPARLLNLSAVLSQYIRAGLDPPFDPETPPAPAPDDDHPECTPAQAQRLERMLAGEHTAALGEWLTRVAAAGRRIPAGSLADLLPIAGRQRALQGPLGLVLGRRGHWLAALNPDWTFVASGGRPADPQAAWDTGSRAERIGALVSLRESEPARGRALLESTWASEPADERAAFIQALSAGLGPDDEQLLEAALDDRSKAVRREAAELLARLPGSSLAHRMAERAAGLLRWDGNALAVSPPTGCDAGMVRDGVTAKPPAGVGERAWWLRQVVGATAVGDWEGTVGLAPSDLVAAALATEWADDLWLSWASATVRGRNADWAMCLLRAHPAGAEIERRLGELLAVTPAKDRDATVCGRLEADPGTLQTEHPAWPLIRCLSAPVGPVLGELLVRRVRATVLDDESHKPRPRYNYELAQFIGRMGSLLPPGLFPAMERLWPAEESHTYYGSVAEQMKSELRFRFEMDQEFAR